MVSEQFALYNKGVNPMEVKAMSILTVENLRKVYSTRFGGNQVEALKKVNFSVEEGEYVAIMGESGSGKTTLLNLLAALDKPTGGTVILDGQDLGKIKESDIATFRRDNLGFVFQEFNLLDTFTIQDNILLPLVLAGKSYDEMSSRLLPIAKDLGLTPLLKKYPYEVSGGQKQRAAAARALITNPRLILADERARLQVHRRASRPVRADKQKGSDHSHGHALGQGRIPRAAHPVHKGRRGVPPDLPRRMHRSAALPEDLRHPYYSCIGR